MERLLSSPVRSIAGLAVRLDRRGRRGSSPRPPRFTGSTTRLISIDVTMDWSGNQVIPHRQIREKPAPGDGEVNAENVGLISAI